MTGGAARYADRGLVPRALAALHIASDADLPKQTTLVKDENGKLTGAVTGNLVELFDRLPKPTFDDQVAGTKLFFRELNRLGMTGVVDPGGNNVTPAEYQALFKVWRDKQLTVRVAYSQSGEWVPHPTYGEGEESTFELVVAGRELDNGDVAVMMVEAGGTAKSFDYYDNGAPKVDESALARGLEASKTWIKESIALQRQLVASVISVKGPITPMEYSVAVDYAPEVFAAVERVATAALTPAIAIAGKAERNAATDAAAALAISELCSEGAEFAGRDREVKEAVRSLTKKLVRKRIVEEGKRIDGRGPRDLRPISSETGVLPTAHGTGLFQRGETQVMNVVTMAMPRMNQLLDTLSPETNKYFLFHYNMAPWANGETGRVGSPKRREIGHGALAARALLPVLPSLETFNYTLRLVAEVLSSNGSTSMASVCSGSLALMDAGVPVRAAVAGIAMGLVYAEGKYTTLTDILGAEDAFGDMDFKVAGTSDAITALQLDTKIDGIPADVLAAALDQAKEAREQILANMNSCIAEPRPEVAATAPKIITITIPMDKIGEVIGPKGKVINTITQETGADIAVDDDGAQGIVTIGAVEAWRMEDAKARIMAIVAPPMAELGATYMGRVVNMTKFGAFVNILPGRDGLVHISKLGKGKRINNVEDVLTLGQEIEVIVEEIDEKGKVSLTPGESWDPVIPEGASSAPSGDRGDRGGRDRDRGGRDRGGRDRDRDRDRDRGPRSSGGSSDGAVSVSFDDAFDAELAGELGDLGPGGEGNGDDRGDRGGRRRHR